MQPPRSFVLPGSAYLVPGGIWEELINLSKFGSEVEVLRMLAWKNSRPTQTDLIEAQAIPGGLILTFFPGLIPNIKLCSVECLAGSTHVYIYLRLRSSERMSGRPSVVWGF